MANLTRFSVDKLKSVISSPARSHLFRCFITPSGLIRNAESIFTEAFGVGASVDAKSYLCKSASLPEMTVETGEVYYFTRAVKYPVRRRYSPLTLTFFNTTDYVLRKAFERWNDRLINSVFNVGTVPEKRSTDGTADIQIQHYSGEDTLLREYKFYNAYPSAVGPLTFSYENDTEIQTFDVTIEYTHFEGINPPSGTVTAEETITLPDGKVVRG